MTAAHGRLATLLYFIVSILSFFTLLVLVGLTAWIRWSVNLNFSFLPGFGLGVLMLLVLGELFGLVYLLKSEK